MYLFKDSLSVDDDLLASIEKKVYEEYPPTEYPWAEFDGVKEIIRDSILERSKGFARYFFNELMETFTDEDWREIIDVLPMSDDVA